MAGIYIHIPFCRKKCSYCDFYSVARKDLQDEFVQALLQEIKDGNAITETINSIYFGGGTPSLLSQAQLQNIINAVYAKYSIAPDAEITLEANPDDIDFTRVKLWMEASINRLSIGVQSLDDTILQLIKRAHSASQALSVIKQSQDAGITNISADLIYGLPNLDLPTWQHSLQTLLDTGITHLSSYHLGLEPGTLMHRQVDKGQIQLPDEDVSIQQFKHLFNYTEQQGFPWYEISNFAKPGYHSRHNSSYWDGTPYLGFGPSAHSYQDGQRFWNKADIKAYIENPSHVRETEILSPSDMINDYLITNLRTRNGIDIERIKKDFGFYDIRIIENRFDDLKKNGIATFGGGRYMLLKDALFISDSILKDILYI